MKQVVAGLFLTSTLFALVSIPDTGQDQCFDNDGKISCPKKGVPFYGQDANYVTAQPSYKDNGDGTVTDLVTGLMWTKEVDDTKLSLQEAYLKAKRTHTGGYDDWRVPTIKELYSLIDFRGYTGFTNDNASRSKVPSNSIPYINTDYFDFKYGRQNERFMDAQWLSSTKYVSATMHDMETLFGVNFADGRIKGYGYEKIGTDSVRKKFYVRYVRGTSEYGKNVFTDNGDGTLTDESTGLMWTMQDSAKAMNWKEALRYAQNLKYAGYNDWRLPNAKELQYIVDYTRSPDTTDSPAISPLFKLTPIVNEAGQKDYGYYWTSTTHLDGPKKYTQAAYVSFGRAIGKMRGRVMDVHGAGAQRSDPKEGTATFHGPQGDAIRSKNYVLCVRGGVYKTFSGSHTPEKDRYPYLLNIQKNNDKQETHMQRGFSPREERGPQNEKNRFISRLDKDGDGRVSRREFDGPPDGFEHFDRNKDGYIDKTEAPFGPPRTLRK
ncbi:DUF1566 domain-containing protein [Sulfurimonas sp. HSL-1716]|uniref:Lcl domain-containing protein n=1 Tax=Hydrocurvibacter sulfurireducens TaxID=3131937 RepID=UPI0031F75DEC